MDKKKKIGLIIAGCVELAIVIFVLVLSILVMTTLQEGSHAAELNLEKNGPFIAFFQNNATAFFCIILIPTFAILALDIIYLVITATKRASNLSDAETDAIKERALAEAKAEVLKELQAEAEAAKKAEEEK